MIKEKMRFKYYTRYMDDGVIIHNDKEYLKSCLCEMEKYLQKERKLEFNEKTVIVPIKQGVDYLGFHFYMTQKGTIIKKLRTSNKKRMKRKIKRFRHAYRVGKIDKEAIDRSIASYMGHLSHGNTYNLRRNLLNHLVLSKQTQQGRRQLDEEINEHIWTQHRQENLFKHDGDSYGDHHGDSSH